MLPPEGDVLSKGAADGPINAFIPRSVTAAILSFSSKTFIFLHCSNLFFAYILFIMDPMKSFEVHIWK